MFQITCPACSHRELLPPSRMLGLTSRVEADGLVVHRLAYRCWCGHTGTEVIHGPRRRRPAQPSTPAPAGGRREDPTT